MGRQVHDRQTPGDAHTEAARAAVRNDQHVVTADFLDALGTGILSRGVEGEGRVGYIGSQPQLVTDDRGGDDIGRINLVFEGPKDRTPVLGHRAETGNRIPDLHRVRGDIDVDRVVHAALGRIREGQFAGLEGRGPGTLHGSCPCIDHTAINISGSVKHNLCPADSERGVFHLGGQGQFACSGISSHRNGRLSCLNFCLDLVQDRGPGRRNAPSTHRGGIIIVIDGHRKRIAVAQGVGSIKIVASIVGRIVEDDFIDLYSTHSGLLGRHNRIGLQNIGRRDRYGIDCKGLVVDLGIKGQRFGGPVNGYIKDPVCLDQGLKTA